MAYTNGRTCMKKKTLTKKPKRKLVPVKKKTLTKKPMGKLVPVKKGSLKRKK